ncbi:hypothetical protein KR767_06680 [Luteibacter anthropi]|uniref:hypothetical protein n=1 Tax=Luteibacter anthropi TaxID=564369 RepID=UPI002032582F|nr:hypothetical protein [Luteibacter anthropi]URX63734.1 hypothetical protein KR767_06680 [Luteibacter anthropi]
MKTSIERDFLDALDRLSINEPSHPALIAAKARGTLRLSIASVARESGHSRTLIGDPACAYPLVRERILQVIENGESARLARACSAEQKRRVKSLSEQLNESLTIQAALLAELVEVRRKADSKTLKVVGK